MDTLTWSDGARARKRIMAILLEIFRRMDNYQAPGGKQEKTDAIACVNVALEVQYIQIR